MNLDSATADKCRQTSMRFGVVNVKFFIGLFIGFALVVAILAVLWLDITAEKGSGLGKEFVYDINDLLKIDPNLILYEQSSQPLETGFNSAQAIALGPENHLYIAGDKAIHIFDQSGSLLGEIELTGAPRCLTVPTDSKIYIGMKDHIEVYDRLGKQLACWQSLGGDAVLTSIAVSKDDVFVADAGNRIVLHYDTTGALINRIGGKDENRDIPGFIIPSPYFDLAVAQDGLLRVANPGRHRIETYTFEGDLEFWWGRFSSKLDGFTGCCNPVNFAILENGSFVTCEKGLIRVKIYDADGAFVGVVAGPEQLFPGGTSRICYFPQDCQSGGFDVAVDGEGRIFVLDTIKNIVRVFARKRQDNG